MVLKSACQHANITQYCVKEQVVPGIE